MKRLLALSLIGSSFLVGANPAIADWDYLGIKDNPYGDTDQNKVGTYYYLINSNSGESKEIYKHCPTIAIGPAPGTWSCGGKGNTNNNYIDAATGKLVIEYSPNNYQSLNETNGTLESGNFSANFLSGYDQIYEKPTIKNENGNKIFEIFGSKMIEKKSDGSIQIGTDTNDIDITAEGLNIDGNPLITKKDNGEIHIGKNSLITKSEEETLSDGTKVQPLYAKDADGNKIPINIDGSKLLIDGVEIIAGGDNAQVTTNKNNISTNTSNISTNTSNISTNTSNIKNLGQGVAGSTALTAALTALPQTSKESKLSCGVGSGAYSSRYAVGFGCASKVNERVDINAGGSYVFGGSKSYGEGTLDNGVLKAGFVFKLGELNKPTQISMKDKKVMKTKIESLEEKNKQLLARLERLEKIALIQNK